MGLGKGIYGQHTSDIYLIDGKLLSDLRKYTVLASGVIPATAPSKQTMICKCSVDILLEDID